MDSNSQPPPSASNPPPKPWERAGSSSGPAPFKPPSPGSTSDVVEASGTARPGEIVSTSDRTNTLNRNTLSRPVPTRPWEQNSGTSNTYGGYGSTMNGGVGGMYGSSYGGAGGMYGSSYGGAGGMYGSSYGGAGGMYGNSMYRGGGYGGGLYGSSGLYGGGLYNGGMGGQMGGYGMGMGGPYGAEDPNNPYGASPSPPGFWISVLRVMQGVVNFFGRISILIDQNTQAFHLFMTALLQLFERSGVLYGELARFVFRILGIKTKSRKVHQLGPDGRPLPLPGPGHQNQYQNQNPNYIEGPKASAPGAWDNVWGNEAGN
ncbi:peroxisomal membrane protein 13-like [Humulus lupulus]|uniref:peroxisomal membrane protein 13-like n=1 Tax=Humulus lupulus TaxID=3486 RepID=UPI002B4010D4|nr:peroxisomal membrane protein 13-like [Humulus lupulus]